MKVTELDAPEQHWEAAALLSRIWGLDEPLVDVAMMRALSHTGNYIAGAYDGGELIGASVAFRAADGHLHSHVTGVAPERRGSGAGHALKTHQRDWALARGITVISWTFDPLVRRNAYFNLHKLGATATRYLPDFYGAMVDAINTGDPTDRLEVRWRVDAVRGDPVGPRTAVLLDHDGSTHVPGDAQALLVAVPEDIEGMRRSDPEAAGRWRMALREALTRALDDGYRIMDMSRDGWYVLAGEGRP